VVVDLWVIILDQFKPSSLTEVEVRLREDVLQTLVISEDVAFVPDQIMPPYFQGMNYGCQFQVVGRVVLAQLSEGCSGNILASIWEAVSGKGDLEGRMVWIVSAFSQVDCHRAFLHSALEILLPDVFRLLAESHAKGTTSQKMWEPFHLRAVGCPNGQRVFHLE
jgi:hypothetical protein